MFATLERGGCLSEKPVMDGCEEWKPPYPRPFCSTLNDGFAAKDWVWRWAKLGAGSESLVCMPSKCGGILSRGFAEIAAVLKV
jgi:hypothetical protein